MSNFTPGPWSYGAYTVGATNKDKFVISHSPKRLKSGIVKVKPLCEVGSEADALLITAAPDLLEACEHAAMLIDPGEWPDLYKQLRGAIAKARIKQAAGAAVEGSEG